jgi:hypothetical protein
MFECRRRRLSATSVAGERTGSPIRLSVLRARRTLVLGALGLVLGALGAIVLAATSIPAAFSLRIHREPRATALGSKAATISRPAAVSPLRTGRLKVGVMNTTGWYVDPIFYKAGIRYERLDVGAGRNVALVAEALKDGITPLVLYNAGSGGGLKGVSAAAAASNVLSLARQLNSLAHRYPIMNRLHVIEFGNEVYLRENVTTYAAQYDAAARALAANGLSSWRLLAVGTAICGELHAENWIGDLIHRLPGGAREIGGWTIHPYGPLNTDATPTCKGPHGYGWPDVVDWHRIAVVNGSTAPWYITEVGQCISGRPCTASVAVSQKTQAADLIWYLNEASRYPWVVFFNWYASCDDGSGSWGLLSSSSSGVCGAGGPSARRPAFKALEGWIAANGEG